MKTSSRFRALVRTTVMLSMCALTPLRLASAAPPRVQAQAPGFYRFELGDIEITALSDGTMPQDVEGLLVGTTPAQVRTLLTRAYRGSPLEASVNAFLINTGSRLVLIDTGAGELFGAGRTSLLPASMRAAGIHPNQIDMVLLTHLHPDHIGGLVRGNRVAFPNATVHVDRREAAFWLDPSNLERAPPELKPRFEEARAMLSPYDRSGRLQTFEQGTPLTRGIRSVSGSGHTPGHSFFEVESRGQKLVFWGDLAHFAPIQLPEPEITVVYDLDPSAAAAERQRALADAAKQRYLVAFAHLSFPGIGNVRKESHGYAWLPIDYSSRLRAPDR